MSLRTYLKIGDFVKIRHSRESGNPDAVPVKLVPEDSNRGTGNRNERTGCPIKTSGMTETKIHSRLSGILPGKDSGQAGVTRPKISHLWSIIRNRDGVSAILIAIVFTVLLGVAALALDIAHLYVVGNELQNAADAGALAGALYLYNDEGTAVNPEANTWAYNRAISNKSEKIPVETDPDVYIQRGHWSFTTQEFTPQDSLAAPTLWGVSWLDLDTEPTFVNAVRVETRRVANPASAFLADIFGYSNFGVTRSAIGYIGFAGSISPGEADIPFAICEESLLNFAGNYECGIGRMFNSGNDPTTSETAYWSNFDQGDAQSCAGTDSTNSNNLGPLMCSDGNPNPIYYGLFMSTTNGVNQSVFGTLNAKEECTLRYQWLHALYDSDGDNEPDTPIDTDGDKVPDQSWNLTLPVVDCVNDEAATGPGCKKVIGAVNLNIVWITQAGEDPEYKYIPRKMEDWGCDTYNTVEARIQCWNSFVQHFMLQNGVETDADGNPILDADGNSIPIPAPYDNKSIYFRPDCTPHVPVGRTGGDPFGVMARIPVLVE